MNSFKNRLAHFFSGRYGIDSLGYFNFAVYAVLCIVNAIFRSPIMQILTLLLALIAVYRMMSRNHVKRLAENRRYLAIWSSVRIFLKLQVDRIRYVRTDRFRRCKHCRAIIKLPYRHGSHTVKCPKCGKKFDVRII